MPWRKAIAHGHGGRHARNLAQMLQVGLHAAANVGVVVQGVRLGRHQQMVHALRQQATVGNGADQRESPKAHNADPVLCNIAHAGGRGEVSIVVRSPITHGVREDAAMHGILECQHVIAYHTPALANVQRNVRLRLSH